jgi:hypothetical protein
MQFKAQLDDLNEALALASVVKPAAIDSAGNAGYLFVAKGDTCYIYSEDEHQKSRVSFDITELDAEGSLVFPVRGVGPISCLEGEITLKSDIEDGTPVLEYETEGEASQKLPTFSPQSLQSLDKDLMSAEDVSTFPALLLKEAITLAKPFMADLKDARTKDIHKCLQIFDGSKPEWAKGNGHLFGTSGFKAFFFYCSALKDHGLTLHGLRIPLLTSFLSKSGGEVTLKKSKTSTYFVSVDGQVIGWADAVTPPKKFDYYGLKKETHVLRVPKEVLLKSLNYVRKALDPKKDKVRFTYDHAKAMVRVLASDSGMEISSPPVGVVPLDSSDGDDGHPVVGGDKSKTEDAAFNVNIDYLIDLISPVKGHEVELRLSPFPNRPGSFLLRTIEVFVIDEYGKLQVAEPEDGSGEKVFKCQVTRFAPSKS